MPTARMLIICVASVLLTLAGSILTSVWASESQGDINLYLGKAILDETAWAPVDEQREYGVEATWGGGDWPVLIATDLRFGKKDETDDVTDIQIEGKTTWLALGARKFWGNVTRPYIDGGLAWAKAELKVSVAGDSVGESASSLGAWAGGGIMWRIGRGFNLGASVHYSKVQVRLFDLDADAGGWHYGLVLGWGWPAAKSGIPPL